MMSSSKKRKNDAGNPADDDTQPDVSSQTVYLVQSSRRHNMWGLEELEMHGVFSNVNDANEAVRRIYNDASPGSGSITKNDLATANALRLETGEHVHEHDAEFPAEIVFQASGAVSIELEQVEGQGEGEELRVWVKTFDLDEDMPEEKVEQQADLRNSVSMQLQSTGSYWGSQNGHLFL